MTAVVVARLVAPTFVEADCLAGDSVLSPVYITGDKVASRWQVATADPTDPAKMQAVGIIKSKPTATTCVVQVAGELTGYAGLTAGGTVFVDAVGILEAPISHPVSGFFLVQPIGFAVDSTTIQVVVDAPTTRIRA